VKRLRFRIIGKASSDAGLFVFEVNIIGDWFVPCVHYIYNALSLNLPLACGYLWSVGHESLIIFIGCHHRGLSFVAIISQTVASTGYLCFGGGDGALREVRCPFTQKRKHPGRWQFLLQ
jgi:hypothetical protein